MEQTNVNSSNHSEITKPIIYIILALVVFLSGSFIGSLVGPKDQSEEADTATQTTVQNVVITTQSAAVDTTTSAQEQSTDSSSQDATQTTTSDSQNDDSQTNDQTTDSEVEDQTQEDTTLSTQEIADLFNTAANNAKSNATEIVQEYKSVYIDPDQLVMPSAIKSICETAMTNFVNGDSDPVSYTTSEEIIENFPVFDETWGAQIDESYLDSATYVDNGDTYSVELYFSDCTSPAAGEGTASAFPTLSLDGMASVSMIQNMYTEYTGCTITAEIDKVTGNLISAVYFMPFYLQFDVSIGFSFTVGAGIEYEYSYTIIY